MPALSSADKGKAFERLAQEALKAVLCTKENEHLTRILHNVRLTGSSGVRHQIDLECFLLRDGVTRHFLVECKDQNRPVSQEKVSAFRSVLLDLDLPGIMISSSGYQEGALQYARHAGIILLELRPPREKDWDDYVQSFLHAERNAEAETETITAKAFPQIIPRTAHSQAACTPAHTPDRNLPPHSRKSKKQSSNLTDMEVTGYSNLRIHIAAEPTGRQNRSPLPTDSSDEDPLPGDSPKRKPMPTGNPESFPPPTAEDLAYEPGLMILKGLNGKGSIRMDDMIRSLRPDPNDLHPLITLQTPGCILSHLVRNWKLPVREIRFEFDNLIPDFRDTILYNAEAPSLLLINHSDGSRRNLRLRGTNPQTMPSISAGTRQPHPIRQIQQHPSAQIPGPEEE